MISHNHRPTEPAAGPLSRSTRRCRAALRGSAAARRRRNVGVGHGRTQTDIGCAIELVFEDGANAVAEGK
jgi:hypothetical protein